MIGCGIVGVFEEISLNSVLFISFVAWSTAQILKVFFFYKRHGKINFKRLVEAGGMPSSHSALVTSLAYSVGRKAGFDSVIFALALIFALVTMYDAAGVRRAAGRQAEVLNKIVDEVFHKGTFREERLIELLGHTPYEVITGALLGILIAFWMLNTMS